MKALKISHAISFLFLLLFFVGVSDIAKGQAVQSAELAESRELNSKVMKLYSQAKYDEALPLAKRALELREKALGPVHEDLLPILTNLGEIYRAKKQPGQARPYFQRGLAIAEKTFSENDIRITHLLDKLGYIAHEQRERKDAENFFLRSLQIKEKALNPDNSDTAQTVFNIAEIYRFNGAHQKAEPLYERALRIYEKVKGQNIADLIRTLQGYTATLLALKKKDQAEEIHERVNKLLAEQGVLQGGVLNGKAVKLVQPYYPEVALADRASGQVRVGIIIDESGKVISARAIHPGNMHAALVAAAEDAARRSLFTPTYLSGVRVTVSGVIIYNFVAQ